MTVKKFSFYGELTDPELMAALSLVEEAGYRMTITNVDPDVMERIRSTPRLAPPPTEVLPPTPVPVPITATSPVPKVPEVVVSYVPVRRVPDGEAVGVNGRKEFSKSKTGFRKFRHPSGRTAADFALEYVIAQGKTTRFDVSKYVRKQGFSESTSHNIVWTLADAGSIILEGHSVAYNRRG
jgi:hypothetical protein